MSSVRALHSHTWWSALFPQFGGKIFLWGRRCLVESVRVMSSFRDVIVGLDSLCAALLNNISQAIKKDSDLLGEFFHRAYGLVIIQN